MSSRRSRNTRRAPVLSKTERVRLQQALLLGALLEGLPLPLLYTLQPDLFAKCPAAGRAMAMGALACLGLVVTAVMLLLVPVPVADRRGRRSCRTQALAALVIAVGVGTVWLLLPDLVGCAAPVWTGSLYTLWMAYWLVIALDVGLFLWLYLTIAGRVARLDQQAQAHPGGTRDAIWRVSVPPGGSGGPGELTMVHSDERMEGAAAAVRLEWPARDRAVAARIARDQRPSRSCCDPCCPSWSRAAPPADASDDAAAYPTYADLSEAPPPPYVSPPPSAPVTVLERVSALEPECRRAMHLPADDVVWPSAPPGCSSDLD